MDALARLTGATENTGRRRSRRIVVNDTMQQGYVYHRTEAPGRNFAPAFRPQLTPRQMLRLGVFGGRYMTDCRAEFPASWFAGAKLGAGRRDRRLNYFGVAEETLAIVAVRRRVFEAVLAFLDSHDIDVTDLKRQIDVIALTHPVSLVEKTAASATLGSNIKA